MGVLLAIRGFIAFIPAFVWKWIAIGLIGLSLFIAGDIRGKRIEKAECEAAAIAAQHAADAQDDQAADEVKTQDTELTKTLLEQKKVDDAAIRDLQDQLAKKPVDKACLYDKSNADPSDQPAPNRLRVPLSSRPRASDKKPARPAVVPPARGNSKG